MPNNNSIGLKVFTESLSEANVKKMFDQIVGVIAKQTKKTENDIENEFKGIKFGDDLSNQIILELKKAEKNLGKQSYKFSVDLFKGLLDSNGSEEKIKEVFNSFKSGLLELDKLKKSIGNDEIFFNIDEKSLDNLIKKQREIIKLNEEIETATSKRGKTVKQNKLQVAQTDFDNMLSSIKVGVNIEGVEESKKSLKELESILSELTKKELDVDKRSDNKKIKDFIKYYQQYENMMKSSGKKVNEDFKDYYDYFTKINANFKKYADEQAEILKLSKNNDQTNTDKKSIHNQEQEINKMKESLEKTKNSLDEITNKYQEQSSIISELQNKLKALEGINDPKIIESDEYNRINEELEKVKANSLEYKNIIEETERTIEILSNRLQAYNTNDVVPREQWENASHVIENLTNQVNELRIALEKAVSTSNKLSEDMSLLQKDNESLKNQLDSQKEINKVQNEQISNLEKIKLKYQEIISQIAKLESIQKKSEDTLKNIEYTSSFNKTKTNVQYNEGINTPENFVKFDYLDKVKQKLKETGDEYEKLIKASVYYYQYLEKGGTEKIFDINGNDISEKLISIYKEMSVLSEKNLKSEEENARKTLNNINKELYSLRQEKEALELKNKELEKAVKLEKQLSNQSKQQQGKQNLQNSNKTDIDSQKKQLELLNEVYRKRQEKKKSSQQTQEIKNIPHKIDVKNIDDNSNLNSQIYENLEKAIKSVTIAINEKTEAIKNEEIQMKSSVKNETDQLKLLENKLVELKTQFHNLFKNDIYENNNFSKSLYDNIINDYGINDTNVQNKIKELSNSLYDISFNEIRNGKENSGFVKVLDDLGNTIVKNSNIISEKQGIYDEFFNYFKGISKIKIPDIVKNDLGKDWDLLRKVYASKFTTKRSAIELDSIYQEMSDKFKDIFSGTSDQTEQFKEIVNAIKLYREDTKKVVSLTSEDIDNIYADIIQRVGEMRNRIKTELGMSIEDNEFQNNKNINLTDLNLELKINDDLWLTEINETLKAIRSKINPFELNVDVSNWTQTIENKITELSGKKIKLDVDTTLLSQENKNSDDKKVSSKNTKIEGVSLSGLEYTEEELNNIYEAAKKANTALTNTVKIVEQIKKDGQDKYSQSFIITDDKGNKATVNRNGKYYTGQKIVRDDIKDQKEQQKEQEKLIKEQEKLKNRLDKENQSEIDKKSSDSYALSVKWLKEIYSWEEKIAQLKETNSKKQDSEIPLLKEKIKQNQELINTEKERRESEGLSSLKGNNELNELELELDNKYKANRDAYNNSLQETIDKLHEIALVENNEFDNNKLIKQQQEQEKHAKELQKQLEKENEELNKAHIGKYNQFMSKDNDEKINLRDKQYTKLESIVISYGELREKIAKNNNNATDEEIEKLNELENEINSISKKISELGVPLDKSKEESIAKKLIAYDKNINKINERNNKEASKNTSPIFSAGENYQRVVQIYDDYVLILKQIQSLKSNGLDDSDNEIKQLLQEKLEIETKYNEELNSEYTKTSKIKEVLDEFARIKEKTYTNNITDTIFNEKNFSGRELDINIAEENAYKVNSELIRTRTLLDNISSEKNGIKNIEKTFDTARDALNNLNDKLVYGKISLSDYSNEANKLFINLNRVVAVLDDVSNPDIVKDSIVKYINSTYNTAFTTDDIKWSIPDMKGNFSGTVDIVDKLNKKALELKTTFNAVNGEINDFGTRPKKYSSNWTKFIDELSVKFRNLGTYLLSFVGFYEIWAQIKQGVTYVKDLDTALTEMRKVSNETVSSLREFQKVSFDIADDVGATASTIQNSTADWMRLGESLDEATESAKTSNILFNVSEFEDIGSATDALVSVSQAYKDFEKIDIVDKMNNIGNNYSIATDGIATALQRSASSLTTAGNSLDEAIALVTAGNAIAQDPESVGAGLRTIALRLTGTEESKEALEELGEEADDVITTTSKLRDTIMSATKVSSNGFKGFDIFDENGNYKSTYEILQGIADVYQEIVETDKKTGSNNVNLLLETLAGKNRSNIAASILQNPEMLRNVFKDSQNSAGSADEELSKYTDSIEGRINKLTNRIQEFWSTAIDSDAVKLVVDVLTGLVQIGTTLIDTFGSIPIAITGVVAAISKFTDTNIFNKIGGGRAKINACDIKKVNYPPKV